MCFITDILFVPFCYESDQRKGDDYERSQYIRIDHDVFNVVHIYILIKKIERNHVPPERIKPITTEYQWKFPEISGSIITEAKNTCPIEILISDIRQFTQPFF
ncbi:MAG: hypothetical protein A3E32_02025 [Candidatus Zambryskibacteria bacterium RIFCSPHIGHO2_12_FULL_38_37]|uniref:Uncharacterized protein n=1 Tax=Candidatus Zambryskibacteria bacterium RIFCSPHIGHO2_12_FULL_38_37 TaxID=1802751 RepID=A0A1G2TL15_9BACT|nr:MAG: hypothetical protein A3C63_00985 [Candidatus Zambryskibacteria bacterium RIFCSPHIGHO2_02_FULL_39_82]OHA98004.1 MAG: hypothetical protein A3E32_02025 [Candidatus Zambryskibacteria bacterium RIFCSPHIGHO2_12_FULL_38_37]